MLKKFQTNENKNWTGLIKTFKPQKKKRHTFITGKKWSI